MCTDMFVITEYFADGSREVYGNLTADDVAGFMSLVKMANLADWQYEIATMPRP